MQELLGGKFGEMSTRMSYTFQSFNFRGRTEMRPFYDLIADIATEEFGHIELSYAINLLLTQLDETRRRSVRASIRRCSRTSRKNCSSGPLAAPWAPLPAGGIASIPPGRHHGCARVPVDRRGRPPTLGSLRNTVSMGTAQLRHALPILQVADVRASLTYYTDTLGFTLDWDAGGLVSVSREQCTVFLCQWDQGQRGTWAWVGVSDVGALHEELVARGARIRFPPTNYEWAYEMQVEDLDGNVLRLGSSPRRDEPYGSFLDGKGVLWPSQTTNEQTDR